MTQFLASETTAFIMILLKLLKFYVCMGFFLIAFGFYL